MKEHKKLFMSILGLLLFLILVAFSLIANDRHELTDEEIRSSLRCERFTDDYLVTDYYCGNLDDYRKDLKNDDLLDNNWTLEFARQELQRRGYSN